MTDREATDAGAERHRILRQFRQQLESHPAIEAAWGEPDGSHAEVAAQVNPGVFGRDAATATLRIGWYPTPDVPVGSHRPDRTVPTTDGPRTNFEPMFTFHYSEDGGYDCGFHNEPNPHVDGWFDFQERATPDTPYDYAPATLEARSPTAALWELLDLLAERLERTL